MAAGRAPSLLCSDCAHVLHPFPFPPTHAQFAHVDVQYTFTATPVGGGAPITVTSTDPDVRFYGLQPDTQASLLRYLSTLMRAPRWDSHRVLGRVQLVL